MTTRARASKKQRFKLDVTRAELLRLAEGLQRKKRPFTLTLTRFELLYLQDMVDGEGLPPVRSAAARVQQLQLKLHALTGEEMPPTTRRGLTLVMPKDGAR